MRLQHGDTAYLGDSWRELAELVSQDGKFSFEGLQEATLTRLYEHGRWWSDTAVLGRPGVRLLQEMLSDGRLPYVLHQQMNDDDLSGGYVALEDFLLGGVESAERSGELLHLDIGYGYVPLWYGGASLTLQCRHAHDLVVSERLQVERLPPLLLEVARRERADLLSIFAEAFRSSGDVNAGVCIHRVPDLEGGACAYIVSRVPGALPFLRSLGLRVEEGGNLSHAVQEMGLGNGRDTALMADLVVCSGILGDETSILRAADESPRCALGIQLRMTGEFYSEAGGGDGFFLFCVDSSSAEATAFMGLVRAAVSGRVPG